MSRAHECIDAKLSVAERALYLLQAGTRLIDTLIATVNLRVRRYVDIGSTTGGR